MVQSSLTRLDYQKLLSCYGFHKEHGLRNSSNFFRFFKTVIKVFIVFKIFPPCLKNESVNQLKANFICWKATRVSLDHTHRLAVFAHFERHLPPSLWGLWYYKLVKVFIISICNKLFQRKAYISNFGISKKVPIWD